MVEVTAQWPQAARDAYAKAGYQWAPRCSKGQAWDMGQTRWCVGKAQWATKLDLINGKEVTP